jgi:hypothetical protein
VGVEAALLVGLLVLLLGLLLIAGRGRAGRDRVRRRDEGGGSTAPDFHGGSSGSQDHSLVAARGSGGDAGPGHRGHYGTAPVEESAASPVAVKQRAATVVPQHRYQYQKPQVATRVVLQDSLDTKQAPGGVQDLSACDMYDDQDL